MSNIKDRLPAVLKNSTRVITRAVFWKIPHDSGEDEVEI